MISQNSNSAISGEYKIIVSRPDGSKEDTGWFKNMILNTGLDLLGGTNNPFSYCQVGSGSAAAAETQTGLISRIAGAALLTTTRSSLGAPNYEAEWVFKYSFAIGAVVGNVSEIGIGRDATGVLPLFSRALTVNGVGTPTTITVTSADQLDVFYRLKIEPVISDVVGSFVISGVTYNYTVRPISIGNFATYDVNLFSGFSLHGNLKAHGGAFALQAITAAEAVGGVSQSSIVTNAYATGSYERTSVATYSVTTANIAGGITGFTSYFGSSNSSNILAMAYQILLDKAIPKTATGALTITRKFSWARK